MLSFVLLVDIFISVSIQLYYTVKISMLNNTTKIPGNEHENKQNKVE